MAKQAVMLIDFALVGMLALENSPWHNGLPWPADVKVVGAKPSADGEHAELHLEGEGLPEGPVDMEINAEFDRGEDGVVTFVRWIPA